MNDTVNNTNDQRSTTYSIDEIKVSGRDVPGGELQVPNIGDRVVDPQVGIYLVIAVNDDNEATLELWIKKTNSTVISNDNESLISAISMFQPSVATRIYYDTGTDPFTISIEGDYHSIGSDKVKARLFRGTNTGVDGEIISQNYDSNGTLLNDLITLENIYPGNNNLKWPLPFQTKKELTAGELVTLVTYNSNNSPNGSHPLIVDLSANHYSQTTPGVYLCKIELVSEMLSDADSTLIENPHSVPFNPSDATANLIYTDGSVVNINIDGSKCILENIDGYDSSYLGTPRNVTLAYYPTADEPMIGGAGGTNKFLASHYRLGNYRYNAAESIKLFCAPKYNGQSNGWSLSWHLTNLVGDLYQDVTNLVVVSLSDGAPFNPLDYGTTQSLRLALQLNDVDPMYTDYMHTQSLNVMVNYPGNPGTQPFTIDYVGDAILIYGEDLKAAVKNDAAGNLVNLANGKTDLLSWLDLVYKPIHPQYDPESQLVPATPTHFVVEYGGSELLSPISTWGDNLVMPGGTPDFADEDTLVVRWVNRVGSNDYILGHSPLFISVEL